MAATATAATTDHGRIVSSFAQSLLLFFAAGQIGERHTEAGGVGQGGRPIKVDSSVTLRVDDSLRRTGRNFGSRGSRRRRSRDGRYAIDDCTVR